jgi:hypothetical protein
MKNFTKTCIIGLTFLTFFSCTVSFPDLKKADDYSKKIIVSLQENDWDTIWDNSSLTYQKKISYERLLRLKKWVKDELGYIKRYKKTYFYSGSSFTIKGENYVKIFYEVTFSKGKGQIEMTLIQENKDFKIMTLDFVKKPVY